MGLKVNCIILKKPLDKMYLFYYLNYAMYFSRQKPKYKTLEEFKKNKHFTNKKLANLFGISESLISHYFTGRRGFGKKLALKIHRETGIPLEILIQ